MAAKRRKTLLILAAILAAALIGLFFLRWLDRNAAEGLQSHAGRTSSDKSFSSMMKPTGRAPGSRAEGPVRSIPAGRSGQKRSSDTPLFIMEGRVLSDQGEGLAGAHLDIFVGPSSEGQESPEWALETAEGGAYRLQLGFSEYKLLRMRIQKAGFLGRVEAVQIQGEGGVKMDFILYRFASTLSGRVLDSQGKGVPGAQVRVHVPHRGRAEIGTLGFIAPDFREVYSASDGRFVFSDLSPGPVGMEIVPKDDIPSTRNLELKPGENSIEIRLGRTQQLKVRVTSRAGQPIPKAAVSNLWPDSSVLQGQTNADGIAVLRIPADSKDQEMDFGVKAKGYFYKVVECRPGTTRLDVVMQEAAELIGRVTTEQGQPLEGCRVFSQARITAGPDNRQEAFPGGGLGRTDQDGRFSVEGIESGRLGIGCKGFPGVSRAVSAEDAGREITIVLKDQDSALAGQVVDPSGRPVTDFYVSLEGRSAEDPTDASRESLHLQLSFHDPHGHFSIPALSAGVWLVSAWSDDGSMAAAPIRTELLSHQVTEGLIIRLTPM